MAVAQSVNVASWFKGGELSFAFGLNNSFSRLGSVFNSSIVPAIYATKGLGPALAIGLVICIYSLFNAFGIVYLDKKAEQTQKESGNNQAINSEEKFKWSDLT